MLSIPSCTIWVRITWHFENGTVTRGKMNNSSVETRGSNWSQFLRLVNYVASLADSTNENSKCRSTPTAVPQLGDLIFSVAQLLVVPNFIDGCESTTCRSSDSGRPGGSSLDNTIVRDLFVMSARQFADCYLNELVRNCDLAERSRVFQVKTWLSCRVHFDHQLIGAMTQHLGNIGTNNETLRNVEKSISNATNGRLVFRETEDKATLSRIESFSPTFALFTLCNIREEYMATAFTQQNRFSVVDNSASTNVGKPPTVETCLVLYGENGQPDQYRERKNDATKRLFESGSSTQVQKSWPEQRLLANARGLVNRDKTLQRFVNVACAESNERGDKSHHSTDDTPEAIKLFDRHDYFESRYQADRSSATLALVRGFDTYRALLNNLCLAWGKLNYLEPRIFT